MLVGGERNAKAEMLLNQNLPSSGQVCRDFELTVVKTYLGSDASHQMTCICLKVCKKFPFLFFKRLNVNPIIIWD